MLFLTYCGLVLGVKRNFEVGILHKLIKVVKGFFGGHQYQIPSKWAVRPFSSSSTSSAQSSAFITSQGYLTLPHSKHWYSPRGVSFSQRLLCFSRKAWRSSGVMLYLPSRQFQVCWVLHELNFPTVPVSAKQHNLGLTNGGNGVHVFITVVLATQSFHKLHLVTYR